MNELSIEKEIMRETIQALTFTNCIGGSALAISVQRWENPDYLEEPVSVAEITYVRQAQKILSVLVTEKSSISSTTSFKKLIPAPKIYDDTVFENQIKLYNIMSGIIGMSPVNEYEIVTLESINRALSIDDEPLDMDYALLAKYYPYINAKGRDGFNFIEYIFLLNLTVNTTGKTIQTLNAPINNPKRRYRAKKWLKNLIGNWDSKKTYRLCVDTFLDVYCDKLATKYDGFADVAIRMELPDRYKSRKDPYRALKTALRKEKPGVVGIPCDYVLNPFEELSCENLNTIFDYMESDVIQIARGILIGKYPTYTNKMPICELSAEMLSDNDKLAVIDTMKRIYKVSNKDLYHMYNRPAKGELREELTPNNIEFINRAVINNYIKAQNLAYQIDKYISIALQFSKGLLRNFSEYETYKNI